MIPYSYCINFLYIVFHIELFSPHLSFIFIPKRFSTININLNRLNLWFLFSLLLNALMKSFSNGLPFLPYGMTKIFRLPYPPYTLLALH
jgi:hypothetical protein